MKYLISSLAVAALVAGSVPALAADAPSTAAPKEHSMKKAHHAKTHGEGMAHHRMKKSKMDKKSGSPDHSADSLNAAELQKIQAGK